MMRFKCAAPGCYLLVDVSGDYCQAHQGNRIQAERIKAEQTKQRWDDHHSRIEYGAMWHSSAWRKARADRLKMEPACRICGAPATTVDHIIPHRGRAEYMLNQDNLQSLCKRCHAAKSRKDRDA